MFKSKQTDRRAKKPHFKINLVKFDDGVMKNNLN